MKEEKKKAQTILDTERATVVISVSVLFSLFTYITGNDR